MKRKKAPLFPLLFFTLFPIALMMGGLFLCYHVTGFHISKIRSNLSFNENWAIDSLTEKQEKQLREEIFKQNYYYFSSENYYYTFISEDRRYVLKFFKTKNLSPKGWLIHYPLSFLRYLGYDYQTNTQFLSEHVFVACKNAYESLRAESGLIYIHLNKTREFRSKTCFIDTKGKKHLIDLDTVEFTIQKKSVPIFKYLESLIQEERAETLRTAIRSFLQLIAIRCEKGFAAPNVALQNHYGFIEEQPIQVDCGILTRDLSMKYPMNIQREILQATERLNIWANEYYPEITFLIQEEAQKIINQVFSLLRQDKHQNARKAQDIPYLARS